MRHLFSAVILCLTAFICFSEIKTYEVDRYGKFYQLYLQSDSGYFTPVTERISPIDDVNKGNFIPFAYDKKMKHVYGISLNAVAQLVPSKELNGRLKKDKTLFHSTNESELQLLVKQFVDSLNAKFVLLNAKRREFIRDSIATALRKVEERKMLLRKQAEEDSLARVKAAQEKSMRLQEYRDSTRWEVFTFLNPLLCSNCNENKIPELLYKIANDTLIWITSEPGFTSFIRNTIMWHSTPLKDVLKSNPDFQIHLDAYSDSLCGDTTQCNIESMNSLSEELNLDELKKAAPNGFIYKWGWNNEYGFISFHAGFCNMNTKTLKYIEFFFSIYNDVGDKRVSGSFKGTGPVEYLSNGEWKWDTSRYYAAGDASHMQLTKIVITYMNGSTLTIPKNKILIDTND